MRFINADEFIIDDPPRSRQHVDMPDFGVYSYEQRSVMSTHDKHQSSIDLEGLIKRRDTLTFRIALVICRSDSKRKRKEIEKLVGASASKVIRRIKWLIEDDVIAYDAVPHDNEGMPPSHLYFGTGRISLEQLEWCLENAQYKEVLPTKNFARQGAPIRGINPSKSSDLLDGVINVSVKDFLESLKPRARRSHLALLAQFVHLEEMTMRNAADISGDPPQTQHSRFTRLLDGNLLIRSKKRGADGTMEYYYRLSKYASKGEILALANAKGIKSSIQPFHTATATDEMTTNTVVTMQTGNTAQASATELLVSKLPEFDPAWTQEVKAKWFEAYQQLISMVQK
jgi:hypothetical protein